MKGPMRRGEMIIFIKIILARASEKKKKKKKKKIVHLAFRAQPISRGEPTKMRPY